MSAADQVAALQRRWIFGWDRVEGAPAQDFHDVFGEFYDFDADVLFFDDADPERRLFRRVQDYADAFWPTFQSMRSAVHAIAEEPEAVVTGDLAACRMVFLAVLTAADGTETRLRCVNSQVWRHTDALGWRIERDHTSCYPFAPGDDDLV